MRVINIRSDITYIIYFCKTIILIIKDYYLQFIHFNNIKELLVRILI